MPLELKLGPCMGGAAPIGAPLSAGAISYVIGNWYDHLRRATLDGGVALALLRGFLTPSTQGRAVEPTGLALGEWVGRPAGRCRRTNSGPLQATLSASPRLGLGEYSKSFDWA